MILKLDRSKLYHGVSSLKIMITAGKVWEMGQTMVQKILQVK